MPCPAQAVQMLQKLEATLSWSNSLKLRQLYIYDSTQHHDFPKAVCISQYYCRQSPVTNEIKTENIDSLLVKAQNEKSAFNWPGAEFL